MRGMIKGTLLRLPRNDSFNVDLQLPQQKCGAQGLFWSPIFLPKYATKNLLSGATCALFVVD